MKLPKRKSDTGTWLVIAIFLVFLLVLLAIVGWVLNVVALIVVWGDPLTALAVLRIVGIFVVPLGCVLGLLV